MRAAALIAAAMAAVSSPFATLLGRRQEREPAPRTSSKRASNPRGTHDWSRTHGFSGAKLMRRAAAGTVGLARLK